MIFRDRADAGRELAERLTPYAIVKTCWCWRCHAVACRSLTKWQKNSSVIDDGLATGSTMRAAAASLRLQNPRRIVVAVPVSAPVTCEEFRQEVDEVVCAVTPDNFQGVDLWYENFFANFGRGGSRAAKRTMQQQQHHVASNRS